MKIDIKMNSRHETSFNNKSFTIVVTRPTQFHFQSHLKPERLTTYTTTKNNVMRKKFGPWRKKAGKNQEK
jgi:hypothetical protein